MDLPTYTNIWRIEKRLYKLYDLRLPMPLPIVWIGVFVGVFVPWSLLLWVIGVPVAMPWHVLFLVPPGIVTWLSTRPVIEGKRLTELLESQLRYLGEPKAWYRLASLSEPDTVTFSARVWRAYPVRVKAARKSRKPARKRAPATGPRQVRPAVAAAAAAAAQAPVAAAQLTVTVAESARLPATAVEPARTAWGSRTRPGAPPALPSQEPAAPPADDSAPVRERAHSGEPAASRMPVRELRLVRDTETPEREAGEVERQPVSEGGTVPAVPPSDVPPAASQEEDSRADTGGRRSRQETGAKPIDTEALRRLRKLAASADGPPAGAARPAPEQGREDEAARSQHRKGQPPKLNPALLAEAQRSWAPLTPDSRPVTLSRPLRGSDQAFPTRRDEPPKTADTSSDRPSPHEDSAPSGEGAGTPGGRVSQPVVREFPPEEVASSDLRDGAPGAESPSGEASSVGRGGVPGAEGLPERAGTPGAEAPSGEHGRTDAEGSHEIGEGEGAESAPGPAEHEEDSATARSERAREETGVVEEQDLSVSQEGAGEISLVVDTSVRHRGLRAVSTDPEPADRPEAQAAGEHPVPDPETRSEAGQDTDTARGQETHADDSHDARRGTRAGSGQEAAPGTRAGDRRDARLGRGAEDLRDALPGTRAGDRRDAPAGTGAEDLRDAPSGKRDGDLRDVERGGRAEGGREPRDGGVRDVRGDGGRRDVEGADGVIVPGPRAGEAKVRRVESVVGRDSGGWRRVARVVVGGNGVRGDGSEIDEARARSVFSGSRRIVVLGCTGGAGQSTTALMLGHTLAHYRDDRVVAVDASSGASTLSSRIEPETPETLTSLLAGLPQVGGYLRMRGYTTRTSSGLEVVGADGDAEAEQRLADRSLFSDDRLGDALALLDRHYKLTVIDPAAALAARVLPYADQLVLVVPASEEAPEAVGMTYEWLDGHGCADLRRRAVMVVNGVSRRSMPDVEQAEAVASGRCRAIVRVPWEDDLAPDGVEVVDPGRLRTAGRRAYLALAGVVVAGFAAQRIRPSEEELASDPPGTRIGER
ncbi:TcpE family conjugal transfer membrane protein [Nonomuraea harbinensis]|uniref:TcpE family conjugal transfer membrane protein n=1 Tax=Nonomuraea harbinensis TaxID=1286938 RepID=A0ABW1BX18_9ACTN|nr:TcpE family conjugal transfer membrane protein [Nonomuraea harbinensis]